MIVFVLNFILETFTTETTDFLSDHDRRHLRNDNCHIRIFGMDSINTIFTIEMTITGEFVITCEGSASCKN
jgi:hypothetical protein